MRIASFDIGTKNLAYCITDNEVVVAWGLWNLHAPPACETCGRDAKFSAPEGTMLCGIHARGLDGREPYVQPRLSTRDIYVRLVKHLSDPLFATCDAAFVESQPTLGSHLLKSVQYVLWTLLRGMIEETRFVHSTRKLCIYPKDGGGYCVKTTKLESISGEDRYRVRKDESVLRTEAIIGKGALDEFKGKKDDVADCYLMCLWGLYLLCDCETTPRTS